MNSGLVSARRIIPLALLLALGACGDHDRSPDTHNIDVSVLGLSGAGLVLNDGAGDDLSITVNGSFAFPAHHTGASYAVTVKTQPTSPAQSCSIANGAGTIGTTDVTNVTVTCVDLTGHSAYVSHFDDSAISVFAIQTDGSLGAVAGSPFATGLTDQEIFQLVISPSGKFLAAGASSADNSKNTVGVFAIDPLTGALTPVPGSPFATETGAGSGYIAFDQTGAFLYAANYVTSDIVAFSVDAVTGALTPLSGSPIAAGTNPTSIIVDPSNKFVLVTNGGSNDVSVYALNSASGALTPVAGSPFAAGDFPAQLAFGAGGQFAYVANVGGDAGTISAFTLDAGTGALAPLAGSPVPIAANGFLRSDASGRTLYVPTSFDGLSSYKIDAATGALALVPGSPVGSGGDASDVTIDASEHFTYLTKTADSTIVGYSIDASTGVLAPIPGSPFPVDAAPYNIVAD